MTATRCAFAVLSLALLFSVPSQAEAQQLSPQKQAAIQQVLTEHAQAVAPLHVNLQQAAQTLEQQIQAELTQTQAALVNLTRFRAELSMAVQQAMQAGDPAVVQQLLLRATQAGTAQAQLVAAQQQRIQIHLQQLAAVVQQTRHSIAQIRQVTLARVQAIVRA